MSQTLRQIMENAICQKWSIIPLESTGDDTKRPARKIGSWSKYQEQAPTKTEVEEWLNEGYTAFGVIMKSMMGGFVIDFDNPTKYQDFCKEFPKLKKTYTVQTRKGYHVYFYAPFAVKTTHFHGGDLIGEGSYVVGAGSTITQIIDDEPITTTYEVTCNAPIRSITNEQWQAMLEHLGIQRRAKNITPMPGLLAQSNQPEILLAQYEKGIQRDGRNNTLYRVAVQAKHNNINESDTIAILADHHAHTSTSNNHPAESYEQRYTEAIRTIQSAYKTSGNLALQTLVAPERDIEGQLPNSLREALLRATARANDNGVYVGASAVIARLIEGLHREGYLGTIVPAKTISKITSKYKISGDSLNKILKGKYSKLELLRAISYSEEYKPPVGEGEKNQMFYIIPNLEDLLKRFNVVPQAVDVLSDDDLRSNKKYLQALHRAFIKRSGGDTSTAYCAARLSVTERTILNYDNALDIVKTAVVQYESLSWHNVDNIDFPAQDDTGITPGIWLQSADGKRFPAIKGIALSQLKDGANLIICSQRPSVRYIREEGMTYHDVWWVAPDGSRWGGGELDFPPQATIIYTPPAPIEPLTQPIILPKREISTQTNEHFQKKWLQRNTEIVQLVAKMRVDDAFQERIAHADMTINPQLTLIDGIGEARAAKLRNLNIETMIDMIAVGADKLASIFSYTQYVTPRVTQRWINQAELLLGLREPTLQERLQPYRKAYEAYQKFVAEWLEIDTNSDDIHWNEQALIRLQQEIIAQLEAYLDHIQTFIDADADWLARWNFGTAKYWRKRAGQVQKLLAIWKGLSLDG